MRSRANRTTTSLLRVWCSLVDRGVFLRFLGGLFRFLDGLGLRRVRLHLFDLRLAQQLDRAAGLLDLLSRTRGDRVQADGELLRDLAVAEQLHVGLRVLDQSLL